jgi:methylthioribulose-1-phosphate dehydratase
VGLGIPLWERQWVTESPQNAAEKAQRTLRVGLGKGQTAQQQAQIEPVGGMHCGRRVAARGHGLIDHARQAVESAGGGGGIILDRERSRNAAHRRTRFRLGSAPGQLVQAHGYRLAQVHRGLAGIGWYLDEKMASGKVVAREAVLFRTEDQSHAATLRNGLGSQGAKLRQCYHPLFRPAMSEGCRAGYQRAAGDRLGKGCELLCVFEEFRRSNGRSSLAPVERIGRDDGEPRKAEVGHGPRRGSDIERIAGADEDDFDAVELRWVEQGIIVEKPRSGRGGIDTLGANMAGDPRFMPAASASEADALCVTARWCYAKGWVPATSGNFSARPFTESPERVMITSSGLDKGTLTPEDLLEVDGEGRAVAGRGKPSAETGLHLVLYRKRPDARAILHVHTVWNTLISMRYAPRGYVPIEGYELLKGLSGVATHAHLECVPILENSQDYSDLCGKLAHALDDNPLAHGVLLSRHGLYTWGESVAEARRHLEALEFLFEVEVRRLTAGEALEPNRSTPGLLHRS